MVLAALLRVSFRTISPPRATGECLCVSRFHNKGQSLAKAAGLYLATRLGDLAQWPQLLDIPEKVSMASAIACFLANFIR
jgi:hypothetical protein